MIWNGNRLSTISDFINAIKLCTTQPEAQRFLLAYSVFCKDEELAKNSIGYLAGYTNEKEATRIWKLFGVAHPVWGDKWPTPEEAFAMGVRLGKMQRALL